MKYLKAMDYFRDSITPEETERFLAFLDRNYPNWRIDQQLIAKHAGSTRRSWAVGIDDVERTAIFRGEYVEVYDEYFEGVPGDVLIHTVDHRICDTGGDRTPVAVWIKPRPTA